MKPKPISYILTLLFMFGSLLSVFARAPETAKIVYASEPNVKLKGNRDIYIMNPDGTGQVNLTRHPAYDSQPAWSPTGEKILFTSNRDGISDLFVMNADGTNVQQVFRKLIGRQHGTWAPDGKQITYYRVDVGGGKRGIYIAAIDGTGEERIADGWHPAWSPDGSEIAFISLEDLGVHTINLQTRSEDIVLAMEKATAFDPAWAPDGSKIAFTRIDLLALILGGILKDGAKLLNDPGQTIFTVNRDGSGLAQVVFDDATASDASWSPRGNELMYELLVGKQFQLFKISVGSRVSQQLTDSDHNTDPDWFDPWALSVTPQPNLFTTMWGKIKRKE